MLRKASSVYTSDLRIRYGDQTKSLVKEGQGSIFSLDSSPSGGMAVSITIAFISKEGVEDYILNAPVGRIMNPDVNISCALLIIDSRNSYLAEYDGTVGGGSAWDKNKIVVDGESREFMVSKAGSTRPHFWFVQIPVRTRLDDLHFDLVKHDTKCLLRNLRGMMGCVEGHFFTGCHKLLSLDDRRGTRHVSISSYGRDGVTTS